MAKQLCHFAQQRLAEAVDVIKHNRMFVVAPHIVANADVSSFTGDFISMPYTNSQTKCGEIGMKIEAESQIFRHEASVTQSTC